MKKFVLMSVIFVGLSLICPWTKSYAQSGDPLIASFTYTVTDLTVHLDASSSTGNPTDYKWYLEPNVKRLGVTVDYTFSAPGDYPIRLKVRNSSGQVSTYGSVVAVGTGSSGNLRPVAHFEEESNGLILDVDGSDSSDPDGSIVLYEIRFGDGTKSSSLEPYFTHAYNNPGVYTVDFRVTDNEGARHFISKQVTIEDDGGDPDHAQLSLKVLLEGAYLGSGQMQTIYSDLNLMPRFSPYQNEVSVRSIPTNVVDWVLVELLNLETNTIAVSRSAFLMQDGSVRGIDGSDVVSVPADGNDYMILVKHSNHLAIGTADSYAVTAGAQIDHDFTTAQSQAYGDDPLWDLGDGSFGMLAGDANGDGLIDARSDVGPNGEDGVDLEIWRDLNGCSLAPNYGFSSPSADFSLDGGIDAMDRNLYLVPKNSEVISSQVPAPHGVVYQEQNIYSCPVFP